MGQLAKERLGRVVADVVVGLGPAGASHGPNAHKRTLVRPIVGIAEVRSADVALSLQVGTRLFLEMHAGQIEV